MVITVTLNPMLDRTLYLKNFEKGKIWRSNKVENVAGGKGINVSLQLKALGYDSLAIGFLGGEIGKIIKEILNKCDIKNDFVLVKNSSRIGFTVLEEPTLIQTSVFEPSPEICNSERDELLNKCITYAENNEWMVFSGSVGDLALVDFYKNAISEVKKINPKIKIILDSYGKEFLRALDEKPFIIKPNKTEYETAFGKIENETDYIHAVKHLYNKGIKLPIITDGEKEMFFAYEDIIYKAFPPKIQTINPIGSGDCFMAGLVYGFQRNKSVVDAMKFAIAAGAANASVWEIAKCNRNYIETFLKDIEIKRIESI